MEQLSVSAIKQQFEQLVVGPNTVATLSGDFDRAEDLPRFQSILEKLPEGPFDPKQLAFDGPAQVGTHEVSLPREQAVVFQAYPDAGLIQDDSIVGDVLRELFNEMSGNLFQQVREKRSLAYFIGANRLLSQQYGMFYFYSGTHPDTYLEVLEQIDAEVERIQNGQLDQQELHRCQVRLKAAKRQRFQDTASRAQEAALNMLYGLPNNYWNTYDERLEKVDCAALQSFAQKYFRPEQKVILIVKP